MKIRLHISVGTSIDEAFSIPSTDDCGSELTEIMQADFHTYPFKPTKNQKKMPVAESITQEWHLKIIRDLQWAG